MDFLRAVEFASIMCWKPGDDASLRPPIYCNCTQGYEDRMFRPDFEESLR